MSDAAVSAPSTSSEDYSQAYYDHDHLGLDEYDWSSNHWRTFFSGVADRIVGLVGPSTTLDVGCAKGLLVQALAERGVDAVGFDISEAAIATSHVDVRERLSVRSATEPIEGSYDLISCIEVLEHMAPADAQLAIDSMCAATNVILFSSNPTDYAETTHVNSNPTAQWAAWFAERGFFRRAGADTVFLTPWAILFERSRVTPRSLVEQYETQLEPLRNEVLVKRQSVINLQRQLNQATTSPEVEPGIELDDDAILARHSEVVARDHVMGLEAQVVTLQRQLADARQRIRRLRDRVEDREEELTEIRGSRTFRASRAVTSPLKKLRD